MKVILIQNVEGLGKKYEVKEVKAGYARNYLFPKKLAQLADEKSMKWLEIQSENIGKLQEEGFKKTQSIVTKIDGSELVFSLKVGSKGQLFESISEQKIKDKIKEETGIEISKSQIQIKEPIKKIGEFSVKLNFDHNLEANIKIITVEDSN